MKPFLVISSRRTFLALNKNLGVMVYKCANKKKEEMESLAQQPASSAISAVPAIDSTRRLSPTYVAPNSDKLPSKKPTTTHSSPFDASVDTPSTPRSILTDSSCDDTSQLFNHGISCAIAYLTTAHVFVANCGDCVAVLCRNGQAIPISSKHSLLASSTTSTQSVNKSDDDSSAASTSSVLPTTPLLAHS